ncbi:MAG: hypothetical protein IJV98_04920 [Clostridia bacterium]|nr:hypothetical protein [Clostridia bacterium]
MKRIRRAVALLLAGLCLMFAVSCQSEETRAHEKAYAYLNEKYKGVEFEILDYTQDTQTSGRYTFRVLSITTGLEFEVIMTSLMATDSYIVIHANNAINNHVMELLDGARDLICLESVQCFDHYLSEGGSYRFNEDVELTSYSVYDVKSFYRVKLSDMPNANEAAQCIYMFCDILSHKDVILEELTFDFVLNGEKILFTTSTNTIVDMASFEPLEELFERTNNASLIGNLFYKDPNSDAKIITYITD